LLLHPLSSLVFAALALPHERVRRGGEYCCGGYGRPSYGQGGFDDQQSGFDSFNNGGNFNNGGSFNGGFNSGFNSIPIEGYGRPDFGYQSSGGYGRPSYGQGGFDDQQGGFDSFNNGGNFNGGGFNSGFNFGFN
ncbi:hypothetical protein PMAYCL1PPCAC_19896, partial [Pristionchus mayeri]